MKNLKTNVMETVALDLGVGFNQPFILTDGVGVKFVVHIDENGIYNETSGSYLNGNSIMKILDGKYKSEELPWSPKPYEKCLEAYFETPNELALYEVCADYSYASIWAKLAEGLIFPHTNEPELKEAYRQKAIKRIRSIAGRHGLQVDVK